MKMNRACEDKCYSNQRPAPLSPINWEDARWHYFSGEIICINECTGGSNMSQSVLAPNQEKAWRTVGFKKKNVMLFPPTLFFSSHCQTWGHFRKKNKHWHFKKFNVILSDSKPVPRIDWLCLNVLKTLMWALCRSFYAPSAQSHPL